MSSDGSEKQVQVSSLRNPASQVAAEKLRVIENPRLQRCLTCFPALEGSNYTLYLQHTGEQEFGPIHFTYAPN